MADLDSKDWRRDSNRRIPLGCYEDFADDVESEEEYDDDYDYYDDDDHGDDVAKTGFGCPFCLENFDVLGLCCHIDVEHQRETKAAICPICVTKVETNIVAHLITQHETILKMLCQKKSQKGGSRSVLSILKNSASPILKKESQDERFHSHLKKSSSVGSTSNTEADSLLLSFVHSPQPLKKPEITRPSSEASLKKCDPDTDIAESGGDIETHALPNKDQEKLQRCEFVYGLLFSTIFCDDI